MFPLRDPDATELTASRGRRQEKKLETRAALNDAAVTLFASQGYEQTTVDDLCREANVSLRTFFRYFESKDDVLFAREMDIEPFLAALRATEPDLPPLDAFRDAYLAQPRLERGRRRAGGALPSRDGKTARCCRAVRRRHGVVPRAGGHRAG